MHNKKYRLIEVESNKYNPLHDDLKGAICYFAYFNKGERGWFLYETGEWLCSAHRVHTSEVKDVQYTRDNKVIVTTENTKYVFQVVFSVEGIEENA